MQNPMYVKSMPMINAHDVFIVSEEAKNTLAEDWLEFANTMYDMAFDDRDIGLKQVKRYAGTRKPIISSKQRVKSILGFWSDFHVVEFNILGDKIIPEARMNYEDLVKLFLSKKRETVQLITKASIIDRFFAFQWSKGKLQYPIVVDREISFQHPKDWHEYVRETKLMLEYKKWVGRKDTDIVGSSSSYNVLRSVIVSANWETSDDIVENDLSELQSILKKSMDKDGKSNSKTHYRNTLINKLRNFLISHGRNDIRNMLEVKMADKGVFYDDDGRQIGRFDRVDTETYPSLARLKKMANEFIVHLQNDQLSVATIDAYGRAVNRLFEYIVKYYPDSEITIEDADEMFDLNNKNSLFNYLKSIKTESGANDDVYRISTFLFYAELLSAKAKKHLPKKKRKVKLQPYRNAMPKEMVVDIVDILKHRPPRSNTRWDKKIANTAWWEHEEYPVFPIMMLISYYIPLRGEQIRNLCRANSFIFDKNGSIDTIVVNTDKNVHRDYLQEIPCVWEDLDILVPFLNWHKNYFKHIPLVVYHNDPNSPWQEIEPLMVLPDVLKPMNRRSHATYHKKVLCKYQLEKLIEARKNENENYPLVAYFKNKRPFFKTFEEIDNASATLMNDVVVMYDIHSIRVTGATRYLEAGVGIKTVMELTGHQSEGMLMRIYIRLTRKEKEEKTEVGS